MKIWLRISLLGIFCWYFHSVNAQLCNLDEAKNDVPFPNVEAEGYLSYQMAVEYTLPNEKQTNYYVEYYDILERRGRVDIYEAKSKSKFIYYTESNEAFEIKNRKCSFQNVTEIPNFMHASQDDWIYAGEGSDTNRTYGPSAMFKTAYDIWNKTAKDNTKTRTMRYMGKASEPVRGLEAHYWRRCIGKTAYADYYFTVPSHEDAFDFQKLKNIPLRVSFGGDNPADDKDLKIQQYDIISFQPFISGIDVFQLPKGYGCQRGPFIDPPEIPHFTGSDIFFAAEVIYGTVDSETKFRKYYSNLLFALDKDSQHMAYYYTVWNDTQGNQIKDDNDENFAVPEYTIVDSKHKYAYKINRETGKCNILRGKQAPIYKLPEKGGEIDLTDPAVFLTNNELYYLTEGMDRGLKVNIFEVTFENFNLFSRTIEKARVTHSYLEYEEYVANTVSTQNALTQAQFRFINSKSKSFELLTFNFYGFTTQMRNKRSIFDITECFKNEEDYMWATIRFPADLPVLKKIKPDVPKIQEEILSSIELQSELVAARIPYILVDVQDALYVTLLMLDKPPVRLDYLEAEEDKTIKGTNDNEGVMTLKECQTNCLETQNNCWGFSMCGNVCFYGTSSNAVVAPQKGCKLYRRFNNDTYIPSKEKMANNLRSEVADNQVRLMLPDSDGNMIQLDANYIEIGSPGEDDFTFDRLGNKINPRMRILKTGAKLKEGTKVKNYGELQYDHCQKLCLDFKDCETLSYCLRGKECIITSKYGDEIDNTTFITNFTCNILTRKYADNFAETPGWVLVQEARRILKANDEEECARACIKEKSFTCMSFDFCSADTQQSCKLHAIHFLDPKEREKSTTKSSSCKHMYRKSSTEFIRYPNQRKVGQLLPPLMNITLEQCAQRCMDSVKGFCYGYDFCGEQKLYDTSCILFDKHPTQLKSSYSPICDSYARPLDAKYTPRPYSTNYAGGIGFLCFLIGLGAGVAIVFVIAYLRVNRRR